VLRIKGLERLKVGKAGFSRMWASRFEGWEDSAEIGEALLMPLRVNIERVRKRLKKNGMRFALAQKRAKG